MNEVGKKPGRKIRIYPTEIENVLNELLKSRPIIMEI
jgi:hypothetical protein